MSEVAEAAVEMKLAQAKELDEARERPPGLAFRVGDVVRHLRYNYRGVVCGWDLTCAASEEWIQRMGVDALPRGRAQPFYNVLVDCRDRAFQSTYAAQENIRLLTPADAPSDWACQHPDLGKHFRGLARGPPAADGAPGRTHYVPNDFLRAKYRHDDERL